MFKSVMIITVALLVLAASASAGEIHTRDGKTYRGDIRFMEAGTVVILHDGQSTALQSSDITQLLMDETFKPGTHGLRGEYSQGGADFNPNRSRATRIDAQIDFAWPQGQAVIDGLNGDQNSIRDQYSVRWTGQIQPLYSEQYTFSTNNNSAVRILINNQRVLDAGRDGRGGGNGQIMLQAGQHYNIEIDYQNTGGDGQIQLKWQSLHQAPEIVPAKYLYPPADAPGDVGNGLRGIYSAGADLNNRDRKVTRVDPTIDFSWNGPPMPTIPQGSPFSIRWLGMIKPYGAGNYTFYTHCSGGVQLRVNGIVVIDDLKAQAPMDHNGTIAFNSDKKVEIMMQYLHASGPNSAAELSWSYGTQQKVLVPTSCLYSDFGRQQGRPPQPVANTVPEEPMPASGVVLSDGSIISATPEEVDFHGTAALRWKQKDLSLPAERIAMVFEDHMIAQDDYTWPADRGALLRNGDFVEGGIASLKNGQVRVSSIIFGLKDYNLTDLRAVLLRKPSTAKASFMVRCNDGTTYSANTLAFKSNSVAINTDVLGQITLSTSEIYSIKSLK